MNQGIVLCVLTQNLQVVYVANSFGAKFADVRPGAVESAPGQVAAEEHKWCLKTMNLHVISQMLDAHHR